MYVTLVDPSLFTAPYDQALDGGLQEAGIDTKWVVRLPRAGEGQVFSPEKTALQFYRRVDSLPKSLGPFRAALKGLSHLAGTVRLVAHVIAKRPAVVHFQWAVFPVPDAVAMLILKRFCTVVMTVHDTTPFNGQKISLLQNAGFDLPIKVADRVIVHTRGARDNLIRRGIEANKISVIAHGPLSIGAEPQNRDQPRDPRWTVVLFGQIKPYKGLDVLVAALKHLPEDIRDRLKVIVAGAPFADMNIAEIVEDVRKSGLDRTVDMRLHRLSEQEMADLFEEADAFVFPYREIDASGVYFLTSPLRKWTIASRVGIFAEDLRDGIEGRLVMPGGIVALAEAITEGVLARPQETPQREGTSWHEIGKATAQLYISERDNLPSARE